MLANTCIYFIIKNFISIPVPRCFGSSKVDDASWAGLDWVKKETHANIKK